MNWCDDTTQCKHYHHNYNRPVSVDCNFVTLSTYVDTSHELGVVDVVYVWTSRKNTLQQAVIN